MLRVDIITIFPGVFAPYLDEGMLRIARERGLLEVHVHDLRDYTTDKHRSVDGRPYGGGPGMVMTPGPIFAAVEDVAARAEGEPRLILLTPQGRTFGQELAAELSREKRLVFICGRYEGFDERVRTGLPVEEISIGDYVLTGGELPAAVIIDAVARLLPGVLGHEDSARLVSFAGGLSGHHKQIENWRREHSLERTRQRRPDIMAEVGPTDERSRDT